jgi:aspartyl-tRNA(Asn)/glutamyl-tRNA(Gln) amidotransferase subunit A
MEILNRSLRELHALIKKKEVKPSEIVERVLERIEAVSYTHLTLPTIA